MCQAPGLISFIRFICCAAKMAHMPNKHVLTRYLCFS
jgi:hypothetical protein